MRLIDADKLIKNFENYANDKYSLSIYGEILPVILGDCIIEINNQPTAYDVDKVVKQLEELKTYKLDLADTMSEIMKRGKQGRYVCLEDVAEIVKSGITATNGKNGG